jgi:benzylsuccinate CoA-transferase BbsF subunit
MLLDYRVNGNTLNRDGNRDPQMAPHGTFPCKGDDLWCVISVTTDAQWKALVKAMGNPAWGQDAKFATLQGRKSHEDELEQRISRWTVQKTPREVMKKLQPAGVRAGIVNTMKDLFDDPQLVHRRQWAMIQHPEMGEMPYHRPPYILSASSAGPKKRDPLLGEHNEYFYQELVGLAREEYADLVNEGVID